MHLRLASLFASMALAFGAAAPLHAAPVTECGSTGMCYCMNSDFKPAVDEQVTRLRALIAAERARGKAVGYMSLPLSTLGGGVFGINREVAEKTRQRVEARLGPASAWVLNPAMKEADIPSVGGVRAGGAEYMVMWTRVLEGSKGLGEDFDFVYFVGPSDFAAYFGLAGQGDLDRLGAFFDERRKTDTELQREIERGRVSAASFRSYYGLRASITASLGAHDEWNTVARLNTRRRADPAYGVAQQIATLFDGRPVTGTEAEQPVSAGYAGSCRN